MNRSALLGVACCLSFGIAPISVQANTLLGDVISGTYDYPCASCDITLSPGAGGSTAAYSTNPFVVDGTVETVLTVDPSHGDFTTNVNFNANSLVLTITKAVSYTCCNPFNGPEFTVLSGNSFGSVNGLSVSNGLPVSAYVSGDTLFINWVGAGGNPGDTITIDFAVGGPVSPPVSSVPVPNVGAGLPGLVFAFGVFTWWRRRHLATPT